jgi:predicted MFS family arabinose efflux permease
MSATSITGTVRPFQMLLSERATRALWASRISELLGDWALLVALLAIVYRVSGSVPVVGLFVLARVLPRAFIAVWPAPPAALLNPRTLALLNAARIPLIASLVFVSAQRDLWWAAAVVLAAGAVSSISDVARLTLLPRVVPRARIGETNALNVSVERICFVFGPLLGAVILTQWSADAVFIVAAALLALAAALLLLLPPPSTGQHPAPGIAQHPAAAPASFRQRPLLVTMAASLFISSLVAASLIVALIVLATDPLGRSEAALGALLTCVGIGMFVGPLPISKLMGRLPIPFLLAGSAASLAGGMAVISQLSLLVPVVVILFLIGLCTVTNDTIATTALRRNVREAELIGTARVMTMVVVGGQISGAAAVAILSSVWSVTSVLLVMGAIGVIVPVALFVALYGGYYLNRLRTR